MADQEAIRTRRSLCFSLAKSGLVRFCCIQRSPSGFHASRIPKLEHSLQSPLSDTGGDRADPPAKESSL